MKQKLAVIFTCLLFLGLAATPVLAGVVVLSDNFDSESLGVNYTGFANWNVTAGSVDLIGQPGFYDFLPGNGRYVDMDGSTNQAGRLESKASFTINPGDTYHLDFSLAGNQRNTALERTHVVFFGFDWPISLNMNDNFSSLWIEFTSTSLQGTFPVVFYAEGGDNVGMLLDRVELTYYPVPLPGAVWLLGSGLLGLTGWRRFRKV
jgi:hypothetical protein